MMSVSHTLGPNDTIDAVLKRYNRMNVSLGELELLRREFSRLNGELPQRLGTTVVVPVIFEVEAPNGN